MTYVCVMKSPTDPKNGLGMTYHTYVHVEGMATQAPPCHALPCVSPAWMPMGVLCSILKKNWVNSWSQEHNPEPTALNAYSESLVLSVGSGNSYPEP